MTAAYGGNAVRLRVRLATGDVGIVSTGEASRLRAGETITLALDLAHAAILPAGDRK
jgi:hypothetical protein